MNPMLAEHWEQIGFEAATEQIVLALIYRRLDEAFLIANRHPIFYHLRGEVRNAKLGTLMLANRLICKQSNSHG